MGQSASSQRDREEFLHRDSRRFSQLVQDREGRGILRMRSRGPRQEHVDHSPSTSSARPSQQLEPQANQPFATFSRQISAQSIPVLGSLANNSDNSTRDEIFYEQQEVRSLVHMEDLGMRDAPITHITASPMPRRHSVISRLGSRLLHRQSIAATASASGSDDSGYEEAQAIRRRLSGFPTRSALRPERPERSERDERPETSGRIRLPFIGALSPGSLASSRPRRRRDLALISRPYPLMVDASLPSPMFGASSLQESLPENNAPSTGLDSQHDSTPTSLRNSRLSRVRRSLLISFESLFSPARNDASHALDTQTTPRRPSRGAIPNDTDFLLPPLSSTDTTIDLNNPSLEQTSIPGREQIMHGFPNVAEAHEHLNTWADRGSSGRREARRMPNMLRGRSSRLIRRDDEGPLPRILHLAAAAIAAQLSGTPEQAITNMQAIGADGLDGSLNALFRTLQHATTSVGDVRPSEAGGDTTRTPGTLPPLNFLRVFRFVNQSPDNGSVPRGRAEDRAARTTVTDDVPDGSDGRTVTLVVVGVRSVPTEHVGHEDAAIAEPSLDALLSLPLTPPHNTTRSGAGGLLRHADGRSRFPHRRRASMGGVNTFPANYDSQRHQRMLNSSRQGSIDTSSVSTSASPLALSESPPGPNPPPSTPADPGLSAYSSGTTTPNRRPSSASAVHNTSQSRDIASHQIHEAGMVTHDEQSPRFVQQRRRSDSEFARHRDLGAGAARRNGVVEPDEMEPGDPPTQGSRSWLIYVVGTNLSEDHPAFATPSLFTDVSGL